MDIISDSISSILKTIGTVNDFKFEKFVSANESCPICIDTEISEDYLKVDGCGHVFHEKCLNGWIDGNGKSCPMCRGVLGEKRYKRNEEYTENDIEALRMVGEIMGDLFNVMGRSLESRVGLYHGGGMSSYSFINRPIYVHTDFHNRNIEAFDFTTPEPFDFTNPENPVNEEKRKKKLKVEQEFRQTKCVSKKMSSKLLLKGKERKKMNVRKFGTACN